MSKPDLDRQRLKWTEMFSDNPAMLGSGLSEPGAYALQTFVQGDRKTILELGGGQGRDSIPFAQSGLQVTVLDYAQSGVQAINRSAEESGLTDLVNVSWHDVKTPLPFADASFDACYSHMLYCMAFTIAELEQLASEVRRVLRPNGISIYTARNTGDPHYGTGIHHGEGLFEIGGVIVHSFGTRTIERLAKGYELLDITEFEEGHLPRRLYRVTLRKAG